MPRTPRPSARFGAALSGHHPNRPKHFYRFNDREHADSRQFVRSLRLRPDVFLAQTQPGFEGVAWDEIAGRVEAAPELSSLDSQQSCSTTAPYRLGGHGRVSRARELGRRNVPDRAGMTIFTVPRLEPLRLLRTCEDLFAVVGYRDGLTGEPDALERIAAVAREAPYVEQALATRSRLMPGLRAGHRLRYRVIVRMAGEQQYRRVDVARAISRAIAERGDHSWRPSADEADVEFWATLLHSKTLNQRPHPASPAGDKDYWDGRGLSRGVSKPQAATPFSQHPANELILAIRLSDERMRQRDYKVAHVPGSLRPAVAAALALLSRPLPEDVVLDPFCGAGTVLIERAHLGRYRTLIGCDHDAAALSAARENVGPRYKPLELHRWDATAIPLPDHSVSKIITNLPWGIRHGSHEANRQLYPRALREFHRLLLPGGRIVILTSETRLMSDLITRGLFRPDRIQRVSILGVSAALYLSSVQH